MIIGRLSVLTLLCLPLVANGQISKGDSIIIVNNKCCTPDYIRKDWALTVHETYISNHMAGKTYQVYKTKNGFAYFKAWDKKINDWSPLKFKLDIQCASQSNTVTVIKAAQ